MALPERLYACMIHVLTRLQSHDIFLQNLWQYDIPPPDRASKLLKSLTDSLQWFLQDTQEIIRNTPKCVWPIELQSTYNAQYYQGRGGSQILKSTAEKIEVSRPKRNPETEEPSTWKTLCRVELHIYKTCSQKRLHVKIKNLSEGIPEPLLHHFLGTKEGLWQRGLWLLWLPQFPSSVQFQTPSSHVDMLVGPLLTEKNNNIIFFRKLPFKEMDAHLINH